MRIHRGVLAVSYMPYLLAFATGFVYALAAGKVYEAFGYRLPRLLLLFLLNFALAVTFIPMLQRFGGKSIKIGLLIGASLILGVLLGYFVVSALSGG